MSKEQEIEQGVSLQLAPNFEAVRDTHGWKLVEHRHGTNKAGEPTVSEFLRYYPNLSQCIKATLDISAGDCRDLKELGELLDKYLKAAVEKEWDKMVEVMLHGK